MGHVTALLMARQPPLSAHADLDGLCLGIEFLAAEFTDIYIDELFTVVQLKNTDLCSIIDLHGFGERVFRATAL